VIQQAFTPHALASQEPIQKLHIERAIPDFDKIAANGNEIDLADKLETMFWEIIGDLAFGEPLMAGKRRKLHTDTTKDWKSTKLVQSNV
jgi:cytochrome P450